MSYHYSLTSKPNAKTLMIDCFFLLLGIRFDLDLDFDLISPLFIPYQTLLTSLPPELVRGPPALRNSPQAGLQAGGLLP